MIVCLCVCVCPIHRFGELHYFFDDAVVVGVYKGESDRVVLVPSLMYQV